MVPGITRISSMAATFTAVSTRTISTHSQVLKNVASSPSERHIRSKYRVWFVKVRFSSLASKRWLLTKCPMDSYHWRKYSTSSSFDMTLHKASSRVRMGSGSAGFVCVDYTMMRDDFRNMSRAQRRFTVRGWMRLKPIVDPDIT